MARSLKRVLKIAWPFLTAVALWAVLYLPRISSHVQGGDTPEIVTGAELGSVIHPPGYPLMVWALHFWNRWIPGPSPYWDSSLLVSLFSMVTLATLLWIFRKNPVLALTGTFALATSQIFWRYSVLPDVFALHWMFVSMALAVFLETSIVSEKRRLWILSVIFGLSFANHHTTLFLAPLWIYQIKRVRHSATILGSLGTGALITGLSYLSLMRMNRCGMFSWGCIETFSDLWKHFSREDYGTFKLAAGDAELQFWSCLKMFAKFFSEGLWILFFLFGLFVGILGRRKFLKGLRGRSPRIEWVGWTCAVYVVVFFSLTNVRLQGFGAEIFTRFTLMPMILGSVFLMGLLESVLASEGWVQKLKGWKRTRIFQYSVVGLLVVSFFSGYLQNAMTNDFSDRRIIEEYGKNFLNQVPPEPAKPMIVTAMSDSTMFALYYLIGVMKLHPEIYVVNSSNFHKAWARRLYQRNIPGIRMNLPAGDSQQDLEYSYLNFVDDNADRFNFLAEADITDPNYHYVFSSVGRFIQKGRGQSFIPEEKVHIEKTQEWSDFYIPDYSKYDSDLKIYSKYSHYYLAKGLYEFQQRHLKASVAAFEKGLEAVPYCQPCLANKCFALSAGSGAEHKECFALLEKLATRYANYYSGDPFKGVTTVTESQDTTHAEFTGRPQ
jgi:hypothetical protein